MRKYEPLWAKLKAEHKVVIRATPNTHARIIKAVTKEKYNDIGFKLECAEKEVSYILTHTIFEDSITFSLDPDTSIRFLGSIL